MIWHFKPSQFDAMIEKITRKKMRHMKENNKTLQLAQAALLAALCYIGFQFFRFDFTLGGSKTAIHFGNTFCVLGALLIGGRLGGLAGAVGMTIADLTSGYAISAPKTFILKLCIGLIVGFIAHKVAHISEHHEKGYIAKWAVISALGGMAFNVVADPLVGYVYNTYLLGIQQDIASAFAKMAAATTLFNAATSVFLAALLYVAVRPALSKAGLFVTRSQDKI